MNYFFFLSRAMRTILYTVVVLGMYTCFVESTQAQTAEDSVYVRTHYTKYEYSVPMRDGVKLFTAVYVPRDSTKKYPIMLHRTPYTVAPYGTDKYRVPLGPSMLFAREGYIVVYQDVRGRWMSEGNFVNVTPHKDAKKGNKDIDESTDTYDTIDWLIKNIPSNNGRVGTWGISYPGFYTAAGAINAHPAHRAASPQAPIADWFLGDDFHHNGAFYLMDFFNFYVGFGVPRPKPLMPPYPARFQHQTTDGYKFFLQLGALSNINPKYYGDSIAFWNDVANHPNYDEFWKARNLLPHLKGIKPAILTVGGWFDAEDLYGPVKIYQTIEKNSPQTYNILVMGPWFHGGWARGTGESLGDIRFGSKTSEFYQSGIELPFFNYFLKQKHDKDKIQLNIPEISAFQTGSNQWYSFSQWPPANITEGTLYLESASKLRFEKPTTATASAFDEYVSDPTKPVPYTNDITPFRERRHRTEDQRFAAKRPDVLVYETDTLARPMSIAGTIAVTLYASTTAGDADFIVNVIDVYPEYSTDSMLTQSGKTMGGYQFPVNYEVMRSRFRKSFEKPEPMQPGKVEKIEFEIRDVFHRFQPGHKIMIHIQSTYFPMIDRNPQKYVENIYKATDTDFTKATHRIFRSVEYPSHLRLNVLKE